LFVTEVQIWAPAHDWAQMPKLCPHCAQPIFSRRE
jgi:hypothetical protein